MTGQAALRLEGLTKFYGKERGVLDLDLEVRQGEAFGYLGPNGAGKTTTIRMIMDFLRPTRGRAEVFGLDSRRQSVEIHKQVGYLPGEVSLYGDLTGVELLRYFGSLRGGLYWGYVEKLTDRLHCELHRPLRTLSHGNRQKIGLAQAFMHQPELLILDEPTTGLDPLMQQEFYSLIADARAEGKTVFLSSHVLPEIERVCDRVAMIREGRLLAVEEVSALKARAPHRIEIQFVAPAPAEAFSGLPGVHGVEMNGRFLHCTVAGPMDALVKTAARFEVMHLVSHEPSLEEIFLAYYDKDRKTNAA